MNSQPAIFIDGAEGTTGLLIRERLAASTGFRLVEIDLLKRKDPDARTKCLETADAAILCLPDDAARESVELAGSSKVRIIDASTAHRTAPAWAYGLPELSPAHRRALRTAARVTVPGCHATGFLLAVRPLVTSGILNAAAPVHATSLTGYSGGGRKLIAKFESDPTDRLGACPYALALSHKHVPEMMLYAGLVAAPVFQPIVARFARGMIVSIYLDAARMEQPADRAALHAIYAAAYNGEPAIRLMPPDFTDVATDAGLLIPGECNGTNRVDLFVAGNDTQPVIHARLDNLGKGASGAALQCLNLMFDRDEFDGLTIARGQTGSPV